MVINAQKIPPMRAGFNTLLEYSKRNRGGMAGFVFRFFMQVTVTHLHLTGLLPLTSALEEMMKPLAPR